MSESFAQMYEQDHGAESAADTPETAPASAPETATTGTFEVAEPETEQPAVDTATATDEAVDAEFQARIERARAKDPEFADLLEQQHKQWQRGATPKFQRLSELEKQVEQYQGIDPQSAEWTRRFNEAVALGQTQVAQQMLREVQENLQGQPQAATPQTGYTDGEPAPPEQSPHWEYMTDTEQYLARGLYQAEMRAWRAEQRVSHHDLASVRSEVGRQFDALEKEFGAIPEEQRTAVIRKMAERRAPPAELALYFRGMFGFDHARRQGMTEGERVALQKQQMGRAPSALVPTAAVDDGVASAPDFHTALMRRFGNV